MRRKPHTLTAAERAVLLAEREPVTLFLVQRLYLGPDASVHAGKWQTEPTVYKTSGAADLCAKRLRNMAADIAAVSALPSWDVRVVRVAAPVEVLP